MTTHSPGRPGATGPPPLPSQRAVQAYPGPEYREPEYAEAEYDFGDDEAEAPRRDFSVARRVLTYSLITLVPLLLLVLTAFGLAYTRLAHGTVSLQAFSKEIEDGINSELGGLRVRIGDAVLALTEGRGLELQLVDLKITEPDGDLVTTAKRAAVELDYRALLTLRAVPRSVSVIEPKLSLRYSREEGLALSFTDTLGPEKPVVVKAPPPEKLAAGGNSGSVIEKRDEQAGGAALYQLDFSRALAELTVRARSGSEATSRLKTIGIRDATVAIDIGGVASEWQIPEAEVDFERRSRRSVISGTVQVASASGPWSWSFRTEDNDRKNTLTVLSSVRDLVPSTLAGLAPALAVLAPMQAPIDAEVSLDLTGKGEVNSAGLDIVLKPGKVSLASGGSETLDIGDGRLRFEYDAGDQRFKLVPSVLAWGGSRMTVEGLMFNAATGNDAANWAYSLKATEGVLAAPEFGVAALPLEAFTAEGWYAPAKGALTLAALNLKAGGAGFTASGEIVGGAAAGSRLEATLTPMAIQTLKALWLPAIAPEQRAWVGQHVIAGVLKGGAVKVSQGQFAGTDAGAPAQVAMSIEVADLEVHPPKGALPLRVPRALISLTNGALEVAVPEAQVVVPGQTPLALKSIRYTVADISAPQATGELTLKIQSKLSEAVAAAQLIEQTSAQIKAVPAEAVEGQIDGQLKIRLPRHTSGVVTSEGRIKISNLKGRKKFGSVELQGGSVNIDLTPASLTANGELLLNGVLAKLEVQRVFDADPDVQPPLRITTSLDNAGRSQLGLDVNHFVQGEMPVEITVAVGSDGKPVVRGRADLTDAEIFFQHIAWRKPAGKASHLSFDLGPESRDGFEIKNFVIRGDNIGVNGTLTVDHTNEVVAFDFPEFTLDVITKLRVDGKLSPSRVWTINARGTTFDARDLFRSLLSLGQSSDQEIKPMRPAAGLILNGRIDNVLGHNELSLRDVRVKLTEGETDLTALDVRGVLANGTTVSAVMREGDKGERIIAGETVDAGQAMKLVGFYPNLVGGALRLEVNPDAEGDAEKSGVLWIDNFRVLGDPVVADIYATAAGTPGETSTQGSKRAPKKAARQEVPFSRLIAVFSIGHGQFVIEKSSLSSPALGASLSGTVDFTSKRVNLGGTYVPLQGINAAICDFPIFGPVLAGLNCEGMFGLTYAIQGPTANPEVIVNPFALLTPGIFREIMQMTTTNPRVIARSPRKTPTEKRVRASSSTARSGKAVSADDFASGAGTSPVDGWSSETKAPPKRKAQ